MINIKLVLAGFFCMLVLLFGLNYFYFMSEKDKFHSYDHGYTEGYADGYTNGHADGRDKTHSELSAHMDKIQALLDKCTKEK